jgi:hypothetical protein
MKDDIVPDIFTILGKDCFCEIRKNLGFIHFKEINFAFNLFIIFQGSHCCTKEKKRKPGKSPKHKTYSK